MKKKKSIPVVGIKISPMVKIEADGKHTPILPTEYQHTVDFLPARNLVVTHDDERINLGQLSDVPKRLRQDTTQPPCGTRKEKKAGESDTETPAFNVQRFTTLEDDLIAEWDFRKERLLLNQKHTFILKYFIEGKNVITKSKRAHDRLKWLYHSWNAQAAFIARIYDLMDLKPTKQSDEWDDPINYIINQQMLHSIHNDVSLHRLIHVLDQVLDHGDDGDEEE